MGSKLPILTIVGLSGAGLAIFAAIAQVEPPQGGEGDRLPFDDGQTEVRARSTINGQELLEHAILTLESRPSVSAKIRQSVDLFGHKPVGSGVYLEQRSEGEPLLRLEMRMQLGSEPSSLLHVCDGRHLWGYRKIGEGETLSRIDVGRVAEALEESGRMHQIAKVGHWPGLGGLSRLLRGLHAAFDFNSVEETRLAGQLPVWRLRGEWKQARLAKLLPEEDLAKKGKPVDFSRLPQHLPDHVLLLLGKTDEFPYRIEYRRRKPNGQEGEGSLGGRSVVTLELHQVNLNAPIHPTRFLYNPGDLEYSDETKHFIRGLGLGKGAKPR